MGNGSSLEYPDTAFPVKNLSDEVTQLSVGGYHSCAIDRRRVKCWGRNEMGQLGNGTTQPAFEATEVKNLPFPVQKVVAGMDRTCAIAAGKLYCWGANDFDQIGYILGKTRPNAYALGSPSAFGPALMDYYSVLEPIEMVFPWNIRDVALSADQTYVLIEDGKVFGLGGYYRKSRAREAHGPRWAVPISHLVNLKYPVDSLMSSPDQTCGLSKNKIQCWKSNSFNGSFNQSDDLIDPSNISMTEDDWSESNQIALGDGYRCTLKEGGLSCDGQLRLIPSGFIDISFEDERLALLPALLLDKDINFRHHEKFNGDEKIKIASGPSTVCTATSDIIRCFGLHYHPKMSTIARSIDALLQERRYMKGWDPWVKYDEINGDREFSTSGYLKLSSFYERWISFSKYYFPSYDYGREWEDFGIEGDAGNALSPIPIESIKFKKFEINLSPDLSENLPSGAKKDEIPSRPSAAPEPSSSTPPSEKARSSGPAADSSKKEPPVRPSQASASKFGASERPIELDDESLKFISTQGTVYNPKVVSKNLAPRGSALRTSSGPGLLAKGIQAILHVAPGAMDPNLWAEPDSLYKPTLESVALSVKNSLILANRFGHKRVAIPLIGGKIFAGAIGVSTDVLAETILRAALSEQGSVEIVWVDQDQKNFNALQLAMTKVLQEPEFQSKPVPMKSMLGSITDFNLHRCDAIVNAANMEVTFGGGISGVIGIATGGSGEINSFAQEIIKNLNLKIIESQKAGSDRARRATPPPSPTPNPPTHAEQNLDYSAQLGLTNLGNTCFANSVLKFLFADPQWRDLFSAENGLLEDHLTGRDGLEKRNILKDSFLNILSSMNESYVSLIANRPQRTEGFATGHDAIFKNWNEYLKIRNQDPSDAGRYFDREIRTDAGTGRVTYHPHYLKQHQFDAQEYLTQLLDVINFENTSIGFRARYHYHRVTGTQDWGAVAEDRSQLPLSVPTLEHVPGALLSMESLLTAYFEREEFTPATENQSEFSRVPFIFKKRGVDPKSLIIYLNRAIHDGTTRKNTRRIDAAQSVQIPILDEEIDEAVDAAATHAPIVRSKTYHPVAFVIHRGGSSGGHYVAFLRHQRFNSALDPQKFWFKHNDDKVTEIGSTLDSVRNDVNENSSLILYIAEDQMGTSL